MENTKTDCILFTQSNKKSDKIYTQEYIMEIEIEYSVDRFSLLLSMMWSLTWRMKDWMTG